MTDAVTVLARSALAGEKISGSADEVDAVIDRVVQLSGGPDHAPPMWRYTEGEPGELTLEVKP